MCGFCFVNSKNIEPSKFKETYLSSNIVRRGGDGDNFYHNNNLLFAHSLFSVTGREPMKQPLYDKDKYLLFNGEIYNYKELINKFSLQKDLSDTEVLFSLIKSIGFEDSLNEIFGAFAICYVDLTNDSVILARDAWGQKPLFYSADNEILVSSSFQLLEDFKGKNRSEADKNIFKLFGYSPFGKTINSKIRYVLPNQCIRINLASNEIYESKFKQVKHRNIKSDIFDSLKKSILLTSREDNTCVAFSGGIDSSVIAALSRNVDKDLPFIHLKIKENKNEYRKAIFLKDKLDLNFQLIDYDTESEETLLNNIIDHPVDNYGMIATYNLAKFASKKGFRIMLTGFGSDELFAGYSRAKNFYKLKNLDIKSGKFKIFMSLMNVSFKTSLIFLIVSLFIKNKFNLLTFLFLILRNNESRQYIFKNIFSSLKTLNNINYSDDFILSAATYLEALARFEKIYVMPEVMCTPLDVVGQQLSIEFRSPFLNPDIDNNFIQSFKETYIPSKAVLEDFLKQNSLFIESPKERFSSNLRRKYRKERINDLIS